MLVSSAELYVFESFIDFFSLFINLRKRRRPKETLRDVCKDLFSVDTCLPITIHGFLLVK